MSALATAALQRRTYVWVRYRDEENTLFHNVVAQFCRKFADITREEGECTKNCLDIYYRLDNKCMYIYYKLQEKARKYFIYLI